MPTPLLALNARGIGWWDHRGTLHVVDGTRTIHTADAGLPRTPAAPRHLPSGPLDGTALDLAVVTLLSPEDPPGVRAFARASGRSPSTVSAARPRLRELELIGRDATPLDTGLFWAAAESWAPMSWARLTTIPDPAPHLLDVGTAAAIAAATPIVATGNPAPRLLTTDRRTQSRLRALNPATAERRRQPRWIPLGRLATP